jgi:hypothetical protein
MKQSLKLKLLPDFLLDSRGHLTYYCCQYKREYSINLLSKLARSGSLRDPLKRQENCRPSLMTYITVYIPTQWNRIENRNPVEERKRERKKIKCPRKSS